MKASFLFFVIQLARSPYEWHFNSDTVCLESHCTTTLDLTVEVSLGAWFKERMMAKFPKKSIVINLFWGLYLEFECYFILKQEILVLRACLLLQFLPPMVKLKKKMANDDN